MRYHIITIGQLKKGFAKEGCDYYQRRLQHYGKVTLSEHKEATGSRQAVQQKEGEKLLQAVQGYRIALDERGKLWRSQELAQQLNRWEVQGISQISVLLGGAEGLSETVRQEADALWSLSPLTFPHELARLLLLEQLYRAETIRAGHPYHRD